tara:strand:- start:4025 stop:4162 length:138 start_codon:yes stop_codon:yes gene_type:complete
MSKEMETEGNDLYYNPDNEGVRFDDGQYYYDEKGEKVYVVKPKKL